MKIGPFDLKAVEAGPMKLDGGAMFGSIPKALWQRTHPADQDNCIALSCRVLLIRHGERLLLVDCGMGDKWSEKERRIFGIAPDYPAMDEALRRAGVDAAAVTDVILTHLHFDHAGGVTRKGRQGNLELTFPRARHWLQRRNWENAWTPGPRERASYRQENFELLREGESLTLLDGETDILPGLRVICSDGHTKGMQLVVVEDEHTTLVYCADLIPTASHIHPAWTMGYDIHAGLLIEEKTRLMEMLKGKDESLLFHEHDPFGALSALRFDEGRARSDGYVDEEKGIHP